MGFVLQSSSSKPYHSFASSRHPYQYVITTFDKHAALFFFISLVSRVTNKIKCDLHTTGACRTFCNIPSDLLGIEAEIHGFVYLRMPMETIAVLVRVLVICGWLGRENIPCQWIEREPRRQQGKKGWP